MWMLAFIPGLWLGWMVAKVMQLLLGMLVTTLHVPAVLLGVDVGFYLAVVGGVVALVGNWMTGYEMSMLQKQKYWVDNGLILLGCFLMVLGSAIQPASWLGWLVPVLAALLAMPMAAIWVGRVLMVDDAILITGSKFVAMMLLLAAVQAFVWWLLP